MLSFCKFETAAGECSIAWGDSGVAGVQLLRAQFPNSREAQPPQDIQAAIAGIVATLRGEATDLSRVTLDMRGIPPFHRRVYALARTIAPGATITYGDIAMQLGEPGSSRAVGYALGQNPFLIIVPCHRVVAGGGKLGGFSAPGGVTTKLRLLALEGAMFDLSGQSELLAMHPNSSSDAQR